MKRVEHTSEELAYLAGILDGEGTLIIVRHYDKRHDYDWYQYQVLVAVCNTNRDIIEWLVNRFGGFGHYDQVIKLLPKCKPRHYWCLTMSKAIDLVRRTYPYLIIKRKQANVLFEFEKTLWRDKDTKGKWKVLPPEVRARKEELYQTMKRLNQRGLPLADRERLSEGDAENSVSNSPTCKK